MPRTWSLPIRAVLAVLLLSACDNPVDPMTRVSGDYQATTYTATSGTTTLDALAQGVTVHMTLGENGTTTGNVHIPAGLLGPGKPASDDSLVGTWTLRGDVVEFDHAGDTAIRDIRFLVRGNRLEGEETFGSGTKLRIVLEKR